MAGYGGDGAQHEVANGILGTNALMGVLPGGTGNGFATELGTPKELRQGKEITIETDPDQPVWTDGEHTGRTPISLKVLPGVLPVVVPRWPDGAA